MPPILAIDRKAYFQLVISVSRFWTIASIFAWTRGLAYRGKFDATPDVVNFAETLEKVCISTVEGGQMTKDLAILISKDQPYLSTQAFLAALDENMKKAMR